MRERVRVCEIYREIKQIETDRAKLIYIYRERESQKDLQRWIEGQSILYTTSFFIALLWNP